MKAIHVGMKAIHVGMKAIHVGMKAIHVGIDIYGLTGRRFHAYWRVWTPRTVLACGLLVGGKMDT